jgi:hypothetical protein
MVKMSVDFPNEAARCQRFLSRRAQSRFDARGKPGPAATWQGSSVLAIWIKIREVRAASAGQFRSFRAVAQLGRAPGSGPGGRGFKSHQPDSRFAVAWAVLGAVSPLQQTFMYSAEDSGRYSACGDPVSSTADQRKAFGTNASTP